MNNEDEQSAEVPQKNLREAAIEKLRNSSMPLPPGYKFDREEAHERSGFGDLQHGKVVNGIRIVDPFLPSGKP
jgi:hypothetical protein